MEEEQVPAGPFPEMERWWRGALAGRVPRDVHILRPRTCDGVTIHGTQDSADVIKYAS